MALNSSIKDPDKISVGQKIKLPGTYTVKSGDTLGEIAKEYGTTVNKLMKVNPSIKDKDKISVGQKIKLN